MTAIVFESNGEFKERFEARLAVLENGNWRLSNGWLIRPGMAPEVSQVLSAEYLSYENAGGRTPRFSGYDFVLRTCLTRS